MALEKNRRRKRDHAELTFTSQPATRFVPGDVNADGRPELLMISASNVLSGSYRR